MSLFKIAITGGIGSGKSTIAHMLSSLANIPIIDADQIARDIVKVGNPILKELTKEFGQDILQQDGSLDRKTLGDIIFNDVDKRIKLNKIMFPKIKHEVNEQFAAYEANKVEYVLYDAPLLYSSGMDMMVDYIILVIAPQEKIVERLKQRNGYSDQEITARISSQSPLPELLSYHHDYIISNSLDFKRLKILINAIWEDIQRKKTKPELYFN